MSRFVLYEDRNEPIDLSIYELIKSPPILLSSSDFRIFFFKTIPYLRVISEIVIFLRIYYSIYKADSIPSGLRIGLPILVLSLSTILLFKNQIHELYDFCRLMILVVISIEILQSIIANLLLSVSDDTIYSISVILLLIKIASSGEMGISTIALTCGMSVAIILSTRLQESGKVAMMLHSSMILFTFFSYIQILFKNNWIYEYKITLLLVFITFIATIGTGFLLYYFLLVLFSTIIIPFGIYICLGPNGRMLYKHYTVPHELN